MSTFARILVDVVSLISPQIKLRCQVCVCNAKTTDDFVYFHKIYALDEKHTTLEIQYFLMVYF